MGCCRSNAEFARWRSLPGRPAAGAAVLRAAAGLGALAGERKVVGGGEPEEVEVGLIVVVVAVASGGDVASGLQLYGVMHDPE
jgi:hypothetical protein